MMVEVMAILVSFLSFATTYIPNKAHNMLVLMLDPHFKCPDVVKTFVGWKKLWISDFKWSYFARVIKEWIIFILPLAYEA